MKLGQLEGYAALPVSSEQYYQETWPGAPSPILHAGFLCVKDTPSMLSCTSDVDLQHALLDGPGIIQLLNDCKLSTVVQV